MALFFQEFEDPRDADDAVYECNGREMMGERWAFWVIERLLIDTLKGVLLVSWKCINFLAAEN